MVDRHQVLHVHGVLPLLVCPDADSGQAGNIIIFILANNDSNVEYEVTNILNKILSDIFKFASFALFLILDNLPEQDGRDQCKSHANPGYNVGPLVFELRVLLQYLWPGLGEELCVAGGADLVSLPVFHPVPQPHPSSTEQTGYEHEDGGGRDVGGGSLPASSDTSGEGDKHEEESDDEESHHGTTHMYSCHFLLAKCLGDILLVRDVVLQVPAPGLHGGHVQLHPVPQGGLGLVAVFRLLPGEALPEEPPGASEVEGALVHVELHLTPRLL